MFSALLRFTERGQPRGRATAYVVEALEAFDCNEADHLGGSKCAPCGLDADAGSGGDSLDVESTDTAIVRHFDADNPHHSRFALCKFCRCPPRQRRGRPPDAVTLDVLGHFLSHARLLVFVWIACSFGGTWVSISGGSFLGNHHPPWEFTGMLRPRWRCPALPWAFARRSDHRACGHQLAANSKCLARSNNSCMWAEATKKGECQDGPDGVAYHRRGVRQIVSSGHPNLWPAEATKQRRPTRQADEPTWPRQHGSHWRPNHDNICRVFYRHISNRGGR